MSLNTNHDPYRLGVTLHRHLATDEDFHQVAVRISGDGQVARAPSEAAHNESVALVKR